MGQGDHAGAIADLTEEIDRGAAETTSAILIERCFATGEWQSALAGAGLDLIAASRWNPFSDDAHGKTWVISRKKPSTCKASPRNALSSRTRDWKPVPMEN